MGAEEWLPVVRFEGFYEVSSLGRVRSLPRQIRSPRGTRLHAGGVMSPVTDKDGYPRVILRVDGKHYTRKVHRLVAEAFHPEGRNALHCEVDHIDHDTANATATNLRWVSRGENVHFRRPIKHRPDRHSHLSLEQVQSIRAAKGLRRTAAVAAEHGISPYTVTDIWRRKRWASVP